MKRAFLFAFLCLTTAFFAGTANGQVEGGAIAALDEPAEAAGGADPAVVRRPSGKITRRPVRSTKTPPKPAVRNTAPRRWDGFVVGDKYTFLNFEVISAEKPYHTRAAKAGGASGLVQVEVLIDTTGRVLTARARTGNKLLHPEAERAALASKFNRPTVYGKPARAVGFLVYRFGSAGDE